MIHFLTGNELSKQPSLRKSMLKDRKIQFVDRLGWELKVTEGQYELDEYDRPDAIYVICVDKNKQHRGSMRLIPTNTPNMIRDHFSHVIPGITFETEKVWECTRLCTSPRSGPDIAISLLAAAAKLMRARSLRAFLGVFDNGMHRAYRRIGSPPVVLGSEKDTSGTISVGIWQFDAQIYSRLVDASLYDRKTYDDMYARSLLIHDLSEQHKFAAA